MTNPVTYIGFSTVDQLSAPWDLQDVELVKRDLLNALLTRQGERVMRPSFGTRIFDILMDPFDEITRSAIVEDVQRVVRGDPRVQIVDLEVAELDQTIRVGAVLQFVPQQVQEQLFIEYQKQIDQQP